MPQTVLSGVGAEPKSLNAALFLTYAPTTPFTSKMAVGETLGKELHTYKVGREQGPITSATPDGQTPTPTNSNNPEYEVQCRVGFFEGKAGVGKFARHKVDYAQTTTFMGSGPQKGSTKAIHLAKGIRQQLERIKWGMEQRALGDSDSAAETGVTASQYRGAGSWIANAVPSDLPYNAAIVTPAGQVVAGAPSTILETTLETAMQARWDQTKYAAELFGLLGSAMKKQFSTFNRLVQQTTASELSVVRYGANISEKAVMRGVDQYNGDFGFAEFMLSPWAPSNVRGYLFEMQQCQKLPFGPGTAQEELGRTGSGEETVLWAMYAWHPGDPRAHIKFTGA